MLLSKIGLEHDEVTGGVFWDSFNSTTSLASFSWASLPFGSWGSFGSGLGNWDSIMVEDVVHNIILVDNEKVGPVQPSSSGSTCVFCSKIL